MSYDNEAIVRNAYHTAEGNVLDIPGWVGSFTADGSCSSKWACRLTSRPPSSVRHNADVIR